MRVEPGFVPTLAGAPYRWTGHPLPARYLVAAIAAHWAILALWPQPLTALRDAVPRLNVVLFPRPTSPAATVAAPHPNTGGPASGNRRSASAEDTARQPSDRGIVSPYPAAAADDGTALADDARSAARFAAARLARDPMAPSTTARETIIPLARATTRGTAGEKLLAEGLVQITNPDGSHYCLQRPPPVVNRDGPVAVLSLPMNCP